jgi:methionyl aminopeptidase
VTNAGVGPRSDRRTTGRSGHAGAAVAGARLGDVSAAIGAVGRSAGDGVNTDHGGHGVGRARHEEPQVPNEGRPGGGLRLRPGLVVAIEPWFMAGGDDSYWIDDDGPRILTAAAVRSSVG